MPPGRATIRCCASPDADEDFAQRKALNEGGPPVVWIRLPNTRRRDLLVWFERALPQILQALERGETLIEVV
jgi:predicted nuclease of predicted toxin-antitoxin system